ncbi:MAG: MerR family transcriptional regulator [Treponema sp.]|jgi:DNA-binding transcriptional MerR regulator|nr:MerR family transcriptional regulator [Treponema sp.]
MKTFSIGEVEEITGIKPHVLRYWEEVIPSMAPRKDLGNRRAYTMRDIQNIRRLNYLINEKKFTIEGARAQLIAEAGLVHAGGEQTASVMQTLYELKQSLTDLYFRVKQSGGSAAEPAEPDSPHA